MKKLSFEDPFYDRLRLFLEASNSETDRGRALVASSLIEEMLEEVLRAFLLENAATKNLFDAANAPLSTLSAKASASRALGLISSAEFRDIEIVRKIRNAFAHSVLCSFEDRKIKDWACALKVGLTYLDALEIDHESRVDDPKQRFGMVTTSIIGSLYNRAHHVRKQTLSDVDWPA